jgi:hypothetical protein
MDTHPFSQGTQFFWQGLEYEVKNLLPTYTVEVENHATGKAQVVALATLLYAFDQGELRVQLGRVEIEYTLVDLMVFAPIDRLRTKHKPTYLIDRATRYIVGFYLESGEN